MKNPILRNSIILLFVIATNIVLPQQLLLPNEDLIFSFDTQNGKTIMVAKDKSLQYIVYRFGTNRKIEFEFPKKTHDSWKKFTFSYFLRGGGIQNEGLDLNYLTFINKSYKYVLYETYSAVNNKTSIGITITNLKDGKITIIEGLKNTQKGTLIELRYSNLITTEEEN
jgi:hypothetical protein